MAQFVSIQSTSGVCCSTLTSTSIRRTEAFHSSGGSFTNSFHSCNNFQRMVNFSVRTRSHQPRRLTFSLSVKAVCFDKAKWDGPVRRKPVEELYNIIVEKNISTERQQELRIHRWDKWQSARCAFKHEWKVDELVYIVKGSVRVTPVGSVTSAYFYAGDLVRYPKWLFALLDFQGFYEEKYSFVAYGDE